MEQLHLHYVVDGDNFTAAGEASSDVKRVLKRLGLPPDFIKRVTICLYEGEINMVIHAKGGEIDLDITATSVSLVLQDVGPGIADIGKAMTEGFSTATDSVRDLGFGAGMGLPNMKRYADTINVTSELGIGTRVAMTLDIKEQDQ